MVNVEFRKLRDDYYEKRWGEFERVSLKTDVESNEIDIYVIPPNEKKNVGMIVTGGMSDRKQNIPDEVLNNHGCDHCRVSPRTELMIHVDELKEWMFAALSTLAEYPFEESKFVNSEHVVFCSTPLPNTIDIFKSYLFLNMEYRPEKIIQDVPELKLDGDRVEFLEVIPLMDSEADYIKKHGVPALLARIDEDDLSLFSDETRKPIVDVLKKVGRNSPCICGSGKKYKVCCGR